MGLLFPPLSVPQNPLPEEVEPSAEPAEPAAQDAFEEAEDKVEFSIQIPVNSASLFIAAYHLQC